MDLRVQTAGVRHLQDIMKFYNWVRWKFELVQGCLQFTLLRYQHVYGFICLPKIFSSTNYHLHCEQDI